MKSKDLLKTARATIGFYGYRATPKIILAFISRSIVKRVHCKYKEEVKRKTYTEDLWGSMLEVEKHEWVVKFGLRFLYTYVYGDEIYVIQRKGKEDYFYDV